jgi:hypothetical protein
MLLISVILTLLAALRLRRQAATAIPGQIARKQAIR